MNLFDRSSVQAGFRSSLIMLMAGALFYVVSFLYAATRISGGASDAKVRFDMTVGRVVMFKAERVGVVSRIQSAGWLIPALVVIVIAVGLVVSVARKGSDTVSA